MPRTLLTGANGFFAHHMLSALLSANHTVVGTVRTASKATAMSPPFSAFISSGQLTLTTVAEVTSPGAYNAVFEAHGPFDYVVHTASPMVDDPSFTDFDRDFLAPAKAGELELLTAALAHGGSSLKHVTITGSVNAVTDGSPLPAGAAYLSNSTWLGMTETQAREMQSTFVSYMVSKKSAEQALWAWVEAEKPPFGVSVLLPALIFAPPMQAGALNMSSKLVQGLLHADKVPATPFPSYVDGRDLAQAHIACLLAGEKVSGKRLLVGGKHYDSASAVSALEEAGFGGVMAARREEEEGAKRDPLPLDPEGNELLGLSFRSMSETMGDVAKRILELEKEKA